MKPYQKLLPILFLLLFTIHLFSIEPNPPTWPASVTICDPANQAATNATITSVFTTNGGPGYNGQFTGVPHAFLFMPGNHNTIDAPVGYYTSIIGLGESPTDTTIQNVHQSETSTPGNAIQVTQTFWRSAENFTQGQDSMTWAVSQSAPLRSVHVKELNLSINGSQSSGGFFSNCQFDNFVSFSPQQQWFGRNSYIGNINSGVSFNLVLVGCTFGDIPSQGPPKYTFINQTPVIAEKPYITIDAGGLYYLQIPKISFSTSGPISGNTTVNFSQVYVATSADTAAVINAKIAAGTHVVLTPGTYTLAEPIVVNIPDIVILGIGFPILEAANPTACIEVGDVEGVRIGGVLLQATSTTSDYLLKWGSTSTYIGNPAKPGILSDCYTRVGGPNNSVTSPVSSKIMIEINSGNVILDNIWAWRADHEIHNKVVKNGNNPCFNCVVVNGQSVTAYGLASEHSLNDLTVWNGDMGQVFFYQSEYPYDVNTDYGDAGYVSYRVGAKVTQHQAYGVGTYSFFRDHPVKVANGFKIDAPLQTNNNIQFTNVFTWFIAGHGEMTHTIQGVGKTLASPGTSYINRFPSSISVSKRSMVNRFPTQSEKCDELTWSPPLDDPQPGGLTYKILCIPDPSQALMTIPPSAEKAAIIHNLPANSNNTYWIISEGNAGLTAFGKSH